METRIHIYKFTVHLNNFGGLFRKYIQYFQYKPLFFLMSYHQINPVRTNRLGHDEDKSFDDVLNFFTISMPDHIRSSLHVQNQRRQNYHRRSHGHNPWSPIFPLSIPSEYPDGPFNDLQTFFNRRYRRIAQSPFCFNFFGQILAKIHYRLYPGRILK